MSSRLQRKSTIDPDEEDARLNKLQKMLDQKIDYPNITTKVLKACGAQRNPDAASPDRFLKSREGNGAWGHIDKNDRPDYGRIGFGVKSASVSTRANTSYYNNAE